MARQSSPTIARLETKLPKIHIPPEMRTGQPMRAVWIDLPIAYYDLRERLERMAIDHGYEGGKDIDTLFITESPERGHPLRVTMIVK